MGGGGDRCLFGSNRKTSFAERKGEKVQTGGRGYREARSWPPVSVPLYIRTPMPFGVARRSLLSEGCGSSTPAWPSLPKKRGEGMSAARSGGRGHRMGDDGDGGFGDVVEEAGQEEVGPHRQRLGRRRRRCGSPGHGGVWPCVLRGAGLRIPADQWRWRRARLVTLGEDRRGARRPHGVLVAQQPEGQPPSLHTRGGEREGPSPDDSKAALRTLRSLRQRYSSATVTPIGGSLLRGRE